MVRSIDYEDKEDRQRLTFDLERPKLKCLWMNPSGSLFLKMTVLGRKLSKWNFLHLKHRENRGGISIAFPSCKGMMDLLSDDF